MFVFIPVLDVEVVLLRAANDVDDAKVVLFGDANVSFVVVVGEDESDVAWEEEVDAVEEVTFESDEFVKFTEVRL